MHCYKKKDWNISAEKYVVSEMDRKMPSILSVSDLLKCLYQCTFKSHDKLSQVTMHSVMQ